MRQNAPCVGCIAFALVLAAGCERSMEPNTGDDPGDTMLALQAHHPWGTPLSLDPGGARNLNTGALEGCPYESPDGGTLFFASNRDGQLDIWISRRDPGRGDWGEPEKLPPPVNSASNDFCPTALPAGGLLFVSTRPGGCGGADIYESRLHPSRGWLEPTHLGCVADGTGVNSEGNEFSPSYVGAGGGMLFFSSDRAGQDDIYVSLREPAGTWAAPAPVAELNAAPFNSSRPNVSQDGREIVFDSDRPGGLGGPDIWTASRQTVRHAWSSPVNLGSSVNSEAAETRPSLSRDGKRLYFGSSRAGGEGNLDLYHSRRR